MDRVDPRNFTTQHVEEFSARCQELFEDARVLAEHLESAAVLLREHGEPTSDEVTVRMQRFRDDLFAAQDALKTLASAHGVTVEMSAFPSCHTLDAMAQWLGQTLNRNRNRQRALDVLSDAMALKALDEAGAAALDVFRPAVAELSERVRTERADDAEIEALASDTHPIVAVLHLARATGYDPQFEEWRTRTHDTFGPQLMWAAVRGHLVVPTTAERAELMPASVNIVGSEIDTRLGNEFGPESPAGAVASEPSTRDETAVIATECLAGHSCERDDAHVESAETGTPLRAPNDTVKDATSDAFSDREAFTEAAGTNDSGEHVRFAASAPAQVESPTEAMPAEPATADDGSRTASHFDAEITQLVSLIEGLPGERTGRVHSPQRKVVRSAAEVSVRAQAPRPREVLLDPNPRRYGPRLYYQRHHRRGGLVSGQPRVDGCPSIVDPSDASDSYDLAQRLSEVLSGPSREDLTHLVFRLIADGRLSLAFQIADYVAAVWPEHQPRLTPTLAATMCVAAEASQPDGALSSALVELYSTLSAERGGDGADLREDGALDTLLLAASLKGSLLTPPGTAVEMLAMVASRMGTSLSRTQALCSAIVDFAYHGAPLDPALLRAAKDAAAWEQDLQHLQAELATWWDKALKAQIIYAHATLVWRRWLGPGEGGALYELLDPIKRNEVTQLAFVTKRVAELSRRRTLQDLVYYTDRKVNGRIQGQDIHARALPALESHTQQALAFARRWIALHRHPPSVSGSGNRTDIAEPRTPRLTEISQLRTTVERLGGEALVELDECLSRFAAGDEEGACLAHLRDTTRQIVDLFDPRIPLPIGELTPSQVLGAALLLSPAIRLHDDWTPVECPGDGAALIGLAAERSTDWLRVFNAAVERGDHSTTGRIVEYLGARGELTGSLAQLPERRKEEKELRQRSVGVELYEQEWRVEEAAVLGRLEEKQRLELVAQLESLEIGLSDGDIEDFGEAEGMLRAVRDQLQERLAEGRARIQTAARELGITRGHEAFPRIMSALDAGDFLSAYEYLGLVREGQTLVGVSDGRERLTLSDPNSFDEFFQLRVSWESELGKAYQKYRRATLDEIAKTFDRVGKGGTEVLWGKSLASIRGKPALIGSDLLREWSALKNQLDDGKILTEDHQQRLVRILSLLEFDVRTITLKGGTSPIRLQLDVGPVTNPEVALVPTFGSAVAGRYQVRIYSGRPGEEKMMSDLGASLAEPTVVLFFGMLTDKRRHDLSRLCRQRNRSVIVVDDIVLVYLCTVRGSRLRALFECTLPFTFAQPYSTVAGTVAPEMFYGRLREQVEIAQRHRSCFIYGGRQLGKTVLLKRVETNEHRPEDGHIALWIDLKDAGVGTRHSLQRIWYVIAAELAPFGVCPPESAHDETVLAHIERWLADDTGRKILLLLDEADVFLQRDSISESGRPEEAFPHCTMLKGVIDRTDARFKVVFAGLHNVVRATRLVNNPLGHFGAPMSIGPLFDNGEVREARQLIEFPLQALGYRFKEPNLVWRILYRTNYYPSLIQLFCGSLLNSLNSAERVARSDGPPHVITIDDVDAVYRNGNLRDEIHRRFRMTLDLDQRYEVIAYTIALRIRMETGARGLEEGFDVNDILSEALDWWPEGFRNANSESFTTLLDEMVGLGVLRVVEERRYTLRNPNVLLLLGTSDHIIDALGRWREPPQEYLPGTFRTPYPAGFDPRISLRSSLTEQQVSELSHDENAGRIFVVCGSHVSGLGDLGRGLRSSFATRVCSAPALDDRQGFARWLERVVDNSADTRVVHIGAAVPWQNEWLDIAREALGRASSLRTGLRVVFEADPSRVAAVLQGAINTERQQVRMISLRPWHQDAIRNWLDEINELKLGTVGGEVREQIVRVTSGWPLLIGSLFCLARERSFDWQGAVQLLDEALDRPDVATQLSTVLGVPTNSDESAVLGLLARWHDGAQPADEACALSTDDIATLADDVAPGAVPRVLEWADRLALATRCAHDRWVASPLVMRLFRAAHAAEQVV